MAERMAKVTRDLAEVNALIRAMKAERKERGVNPGKIELTETTCERPTAPGRKNPESLTLLKDCSVYKETICGLPSRRKK